MAMTRSTTPCLGICSTTYGDNVCKGCKRYVHEVIDWNKFNTQEKELVNIRLEKFKKIVLKSRFSINDEIVLAQKLKDNAIRFNNSLDPFNLDF